MADETDLTSYLDAARAAISGGALSTARVQVALAKTVLAELPAISADGVTENYSNAIKALESAIRDASAAEAISNRQSKIGRGRVGGV